MSGEGGEGGIVVLDVVDDTDVEVDAPRASVVVVDGSVCARAGSELDANSPPATNAASARAGTRLRSRSR
jgi:hypothetical protein